MIQRRLSALSCAALLAVAAPAAATAAHAPAPGTRATAQEGAVFMRTTETTVLRNFQDENGALLATLPKGTLVRSFRTSEGRPAFCEVEVAGGFPVWVYGEYLQPTDTDGVLLVTGNRVNMRPFPETSPNSMALRSKLSAGQRVKMLERKGASASFREDWIRVQAPPHAKAWIAQASLAAETSTEAAARWDELNSPLPAPRSPRATSSTKPASTPRTAAPASDTPAAAATSSAVPAGLLARLTEADRAFKAAEAMRSPTTEAWRDVVLAYQEIASEAPTSSATYQRAEQRLRESELRMEFTALREDLNARSQANDAEIRRIDEFLDERQRRKTARWGRFEERGWLESRNVGGVKRWFLTFGGETVAEVRCLKNRYDLEVFESFEIGVIGREIQPVVRATATTLAEARVVDINRIEVLSGTSRR